MHGSLAYRCFSFMNPLPRGYLPSAFKGISKPLLVATTRACPDQIDYSRVLSGCLTRAGLVTRPWSELALSLPVYSAPHFSKAVNPVSNLRAWSGSCILVETSSRRWDVTIPCKRHSPNFVFIGTRIPCIIKDLKHLVLVVDNASRFNLSITSKMCGSALNPNSFNFFLPFSRFPPFGGFSRIENKLINQQMRHIRPKTVISG